LFQNPSYFHTNWLSDEGLPKTNSKIYRIWCTETKTCILIPQDRLPESSIHPIVYKSHESGLSLCTWKISFLVVVLSAIAVYFIHSYNHLLQLLTCMGIISKLKWNIEIISITNKKVFDVHFEKVFHNWIYTDPTYYFLKKLLFECKVTPLSSDMNIF
jgi:hypothetical protein